MGLEDGEDGGGATVPEKSPEDVAVEAEEREVENARQLLQRTSLRVPLHVRFWGRVHA